MTYPLVEMEAPKPPGARAVPGVAAALVLMLVFAVVGLVTIDESRPGGGSSTISALLSAADKTTDASSARMVLDMDIGVNGMNLGSGLQGMTMEGAAEFSGERKARFSMSAAGMQFEGVGRDNTAYLKLPSPRPGTRPWVAFEAPETSSPLASLSGPSMAGGDPTATLDYLRREGLVTSAEKTGTAEVRGVGTTSYHVVLDHGAFDALLRDEMEKQGTADMLGGMKMTISTKRAVLDLFIDDDGLVRRQVLDMAFAMAMMNQDIEMSMKMTIDLFDFGVAVDAPLPPEDQVTRVASQAEMMQLFAGGR